jgi:hypothetical protein
MNRATFASLALAAAALSLAACADKKKSEPAPAPAVAAPVTYEDSATVAMTAKVEALDYSTRRITLRDSSGRASTFIVGQQVQRLNEVKVGDNVTANFTVSLDAELRPPTAEETANPIMITEVSSRSPQGADPSSGARRKVRLVTTVERVDLGNMLVTLKGPMGDTTTVRARKTENVKKLHVGDTIVINYTEEMTISLVKAN